MGRLSKDSSEPARNLQVFESPTTVDFYVAATELFGAEKIIFGAFVADRHRVLDLGIGAGRTAGPLADRSASYVGTDISEAMIRAARSNHPGLDLRTGDATDLSEFADDTFDVVVFSFNGIDCLNESGRAECVREVRRVLGPDGTFIVARHNPRSLLATPKPLLTVGWKVATYRLLVAARESARLIARRVRTSMFWRGSGSELDPVHGGLQLESATPRRWARELNRLGFAVIDGPRDPSDPVRYRWYRSHWYYVVARPSTHRVR